MPLIIRTRRDLIDYCGQCGISVRTFNEPVIVAEGVTDGRGLFIYCEALNSPVTLPSTLVLGTNMFCHCHNFNQEITLPPNLETASFMFEDCWQLDKPIKMPNALKDTTAMFKHCFALNQPLVLPKCLEYYGRMFQGCRSLNKKLVKVWNYKKNDLFPRHGADVVRCKEEYASRCIVEYDEDDSLSNEDLTAISTYFVNKYSSRGDDNI